MSTSDPASRNGGQEGAGSLGVGGPRSERTRRAILDAAREIFAANGYERTTIRAVAARAGIDASMVMRYFGSKAGLFAAAATVNLVSPDLAAIPPGERGERLVRYFVTNWEDNPSRESLALLMRTAVTDPAVARQMQATFNTLVLGPVTALGYPAATRRSALIATQLFGLVLCRYILRFEPLASLPVAEVVAPVARTVQSYLTQPLTYEARKH